jgi:NAD(P)-dependent dehydrogenase (short-subunit alcohol dehydrogenase family)
MTLAALPLLEASRGLILNAGTGAATKAMEGWTAYCSSKAAARMLTEMQALELAPRGVAARFVGIPPTDTAMQGEIREAGLNPISKIPRGDLVHPDVPASVLAWLCASEQRGREEVMLDVREPLFKAMMG